MYICEKVFAIDSAPKELLDEMDIFSIKINPLWGLSDQQNVAFKIHFIEQMYNIIFNPRLTSDLGFKKADIIFHSGGVKS